MRPTRYPFLDPPASHSNVIAIRSRKTHCAACSMRELCLPIGLPADAMHELDALIATRRHFENGEAVFHSGDDFVALYAIHSGSCKVTVTTAEGREQIVGYHMMGDIMGFDGIASGHHTGQAIALETTEVCTIPFERLEELCRRFVPLQHNVHQLFSREVSRDQNLLLVVGSMRAEARVAAFLLSLSERYRQRGYSTTEFVLRMTRAEIGSYLGLKLETVSRLLSRFQAQGLIKIHKKAVRLLDSRGLQAILDEAK
jgi:CRP/FNR family transcriptional regulator